MEQTGEEVYVLGHSELELERLKRQAQLYEPFAAQLFRDAGIAPGMRVLDIGSGIGDVAFLVARMVGPSGEVVGVDRSPDAVAAANRRATSLELSQVRFIEGDVATLAYGDPFDGAVGRFVLLHCPDPVAVLRQAATYVRPGGVIAFEEPDWAGYHTAPALPTWDACANWIITAHQQAGADTHLGMKLPEVYMSAGLPRPNLYLHALIASGPDHPLYAHAADLVRALLPAMERLGIATAADVDVDTLTERLRVEVAASEGVIVWASLIGAVARKPAS